LNLIDSHCHIDDKSFDEDRQDIIARAREAGVSEMIVVGCATSSETLQRAPALAARETGIFATVGVHPHDAGSVPPSLWSELDEWAHKQEIVAVGETGLDYHYDHSPRDVQRKRFAEQIALSQKVSKPVICHVRDAHDDARAVLREAGAVQAVIHCFTGTPEDATLYAEMGHYVSFSGIVTFRGQKAEPLREAVRRVPLSQLLVETDCPYLAPHPMRGKRNEPSFLPHTLGVLAEQLGQTPTDVAQATVDNTRRCFNLPSNTPIS